MALEDYRRKRKFARTPEPRGRVAKPRREGLSFVVQKHAASRLHYDFRLEMAGVLKSWAVPRGPSLDPGEKRLAVHVEDHPLEYGGFEGTIPQGEYGGGTVMLWDRGTWEPEGDAAAGYAKGHLRFILHGTRMTGGWSLIRMGGRQGGKNWLLIKEDDAAARRGSGAALTEAFERSVASRRTMAGIAKAKERVWRSKPRGKAAPVLAAVERVVESPAPPRKPGRIPGARPAPLPRLPHPQLATLTTTAPEGTEWLHEIKFDGYRMLAVIDAGKVRMLSRNGKDWTRRLPATVAALARLPVKNAVLDGEIVHLDEKGVSSFSALKDDLSAGRTEALVYFLFDLLHLDGKSLSETPLRARKAALAALLAGEASPALRFSEHITGSGGAFFAEACRSGLEGILSKRGDAPYRAGRSGAWLKVKCVANEEFVVIGWTDPQGRRSGLGSLLLGYYDPAGVLHFAGGVGTGFSAETLDVLRRKLDRLKRQQSPAADAAGAAPRGAHWVRPALVAQIRYAGWTADGRLRHAAFLGLREDKAAREVVIDRTAGPPAAAKAPRAGKPKSKPAAPASRAAEATEVAGVRLTHPDKLLYPEAGISKLDLARYYERVAAAMLPHLRGRPLTMVRCPEGCTGKCFYQKHPGDYAPPSLERIPIEEQEGRTIYLIAEDVAGLVSLVQMSVLEIHLWNATRSALETPDRVIFDLDPDEGLAWERVGAAAVEVRDLLAEMGLESFVKTTGGKGLHVVMPLQPRYGWDEVKLFARSVAAELVRRAPAAYTATLSKKARGGKIFIDYLRNQRGATAVAPYSARARAGAPVAVPLTWAEVEKGWRSDRFTIATLPDRLAKLRRDPWQGMLGMKQKLPAGVLRKLRAAGA